MSTRLRLAFASIFASLLAGCSPQIGDSCQYSTNCSSQGTRLCDVSMPGGYCTIYNCDPNNTCPSESSCVEFNDESTTYERRFCLRGCNNDNDCRAGYKCVYNDGDLLSQYNGVMLDNTSKYTGVCLP